MYLLKSQKNLSNYRLMTRNTIRGECENIYNIACIGLILSIFKNSTQKME
jgi:hypothetical protein